MYTMWNRFIIYLCIFTFISGTLTFPNGLVINQAYASSNSKDAGSEANEEAAKIEAELENNLHANEEEIRKIQERFSYQASIEEYNKEREELIEQFKGNREGSSLDPLQLMNQEVHANKFKKIDTHNIKFVTYNKPANSNFSEMKLDEIYSRDSIVKSKRAAEDIMLPSRHSNLANKVEIHYLGTKIHTFHKSIEAIAVMGDFIIILPHADKSKAELIDGKVARHIEFIDMQTYGLAKQELPIFRLPVLLKEDISSIEVENAHSRDKSRLVINGTALPHSLFDGVAQPQRSLVNMMINLLSPDSIEYIKRMSDNLQSYMNTMLKKGNEELQSLNKNSDIDITGKNAAELMKELEANIKYREKVATGFGENVKSQIHDKVKGAAPEWIESGSEEQRQLFELYNKKYLADVRAGKDAGFKALSPNFSTKDLMNFKLSGEKINNDFYQKALEDMNLRQKLSKMNNVLNPKESGLKTMIPFRGVMAAMGSHMAALTVPRPKEVSTLKDALYTLTGGLFAREYGVKENLKEGFRQLVHARSVKISAASLAALYLGAINADAIIDYSHATVNLSAYIFNAALGKIGDYGYILGQGLLSMRGFVDLTVVNEAFVANGRLKYTAVGVSGMIGTLAVVLLTPHVIVNLNLLVNDLKKQAKHYGSEKSKSPFWSTLKSYIPFTNDTRPDSLKNRTPETGIFKNARGLSKYYISILANRQKKFEQKYIHLRRMGEKLELQDHLLSVHFTAEDDRIVQDLIERSERMDWKSPKVKDLKQAYIELAKVKRRLSKVDDLEAYIQENKTAPELQNLLKALDAAGFGDPEIWGNKTIKLLNKTPKEVERLVKRNTDFRDGFEERMELYKYLLELRTQNQDIDNFHEYAERLWKSKDHGKLTVLFEKLKAAGFIDSELWYNSAHALLKMPPKKLEKMISKLHSKDKVDAYLNKKVEAMSSFLGKISNNRITNAMANKIAVKTEGLTDEEIAKQKLYTYKSFLGKFFFGLASWTKTFGLYVHLWNSVFITRVAMFAPRNWYFLLAYPKMAWTMVTPTPGKVHIPTDLNGGKDNALKFLSRFLIGLEKRENIFDFERKVYEVEKVVNKVVMDKALESFVEYNAKYSHGFLYNIWANFKDWATNSDHYRNDVERLLSSKEYFGMTDEAISLLKFKNRGYFYKFYENASSVAMEAVLSDILGIEKLDRKTIRQIKAENSLKNKVFSIKEGYEGYYRYKIVKAKEWELIAEERIAEVARKAIEKENVAQSTENLIEKAFYSMVILIKDKVTYTAYRKLDARNTRILSRVAVAIEQADKPVAMNRAVVSTLAKYKADKPMQLAMFFMGIAGMVGAGSFAEPLHPGEFMGPDSFMYLSRYHALSGFVIGTIVGLFADVWYKIQMDKFLDSDGGFEFKFTEAERKMGRWEYFRHVWNDPMNSWWYHQKNGMSLMMMNFVPTMSLYIIIHMITYQRFDFDALYPFYFLGVTTPFIGYLTKLDQTYEMYKKWYRRNFPKKYLMHPKTILWDTAKSMVERFRYQILVALNENTISYFESNMVAMGTPQQGSRALSRTINPFGTNETVAESIMNSTGDLAKDMPAMKPLDNFCRSFFGNNLTGATRLRYPLNNNKGGSE